MPSARVLQQISSKRTGLARKVENLIWTRRPDGSGPSKVESGSEPSDRVAGETTDRNEKLRTALKKEGE